MQSIRTRGYDPGKSDDPSPPWTSSRCQRMLRPLQTRISSLRKLVTSRNHANNNNGNAKRPAKRLKTNHSHFMRDPMRRRPQRTYSRRLSSGPASNTAGTTSMPLLAKTGHVPSHVPTPLLRKFRDSTGYAARYDVVPCGLVASVCELPRSMSLSVALDRLTGLRHNCAPSQYQLYEGILHDLDSLLRATSVKHTVPGTKSLLSMCLRRVPRSAAAVEAWERIRDQDNGPSSCFEKTSYSLRVYDDLEALGGAEKGWVNLRVLLRAHALYLLQEAIADGLIGSVFAHILIDYCNTSNRADESAGLMTALLRDFCRGEPADSVSLTRGVISLFRYTGDATCAAHLMESVATHLLNDYLPVESLSTQAFRPLWSTAASSVIDDVANPSATCFAYTAIGLLCISASPTLEDRHWPPSQAAKAAETTLMSVLGALSAMALVSGGFGNWTRDPARRWQGRTKLVVQHVIQEALGMVSTKSRSRQASYPLLLALLFISFPAEAALTRRTSEVVSALEALWAKEDPLYSAPDTGDGRRHGLYDATVGLACSIAHCCGKATAQPSSRYFAAICDIVDNLQVSFLATLRSDGAFILAQKTDDLRDLVFAETLTQASPRLVAGYRWEEGISEWIAVSPEAKQRNFVSGPEGTATRRSRPVDKNHKRPPSCSFFGTSTRATTTAAAPKKHRHIQPLDKAVVEAGEKSVVHQVGHRARRTEEAERTGGRNIESVPEDAVARDIVDELSATIQVDTYTGKGKRRRLVQHGEEGRNRIVPGIVQAGDVAGHDDEDELGRL